MKKIIALAAVVLAQGGTAFAEGNADGFAGPRIEARLGWETPTVKAGGLYKIGSGPSFGVEAGYDLAIGSNVVVGPFANYEISTVKNCTGTECLKVKSNLNAGGQIGYALSPRTMIYGKIGYAQISMKATSAGVSGTDSNAGLQGAGGVEFGIGTKAYGRVEFGYADYGSKFGVNFHRRYAGVGVGMRF